MTDHAFVAYGDERDEGFLPFGDQPDELGFQWTTEGFRMDFLDRDAVTWLLGSYFNHVIIILPMCREIALLLSLVQRNEQLLALLSIYSLYLSK